MSPKSWCSCSEKSHVALKKHLEPPPPPVYHLSQRGQEEKVKRGSLHRIEAACFLCFGSSLTPELSQPPASHTAVSLQTHSSSTLSHSVVVWAVSAGQGRSMRTLEITGGPWLWPGAHRFPVLPVCMYVLEVRDGDEGSPRKQSKAPVGSAQLCSLQSSGLAVLRLLLVK